MRDFSDHGDRFFEPVQIVGGPRTRAIVQEAMDMVNVNDQFIVPRILCRVRPDSLIASRQVIQLQSGALFLVCDHGADRNWVTHLLLACDRQIPWARAVTTVDPTTGLATSNGQTTPMGVPWVYWERPVRPPTDQVTRLPNVDYVVATGAAVQQGDTLAGHTVVRLDTSMGVTIVGVRA